MKPLFTYLFPTTDSADLIESVSVFVQAKCGVEGFFLGFLAFSFRVELVPSTNGASHTHTHTHTHTHRKMAAEQAPGHLRWIRRVIDRDLLISGLSGDAPDPEESGFINIIAFFFLKPKKKVCFSLVMDLLFRFCRRCGIS